MKKFSLTIMAIRISRVVSREARETQRHPLLGNQPVEGL
jgi:hypothetical protein